MPSFIFTDSRSTIIGSGIQQAFTNIESATEAFRQGSISHIVGALPFHGGDPAALFCPEEIQHKDHPWLYHPVDPSTLPNAETSTSFPTVEEHIERVKQAIATLTEGELDKIVLSRARSFNLSGILYPTDLLARLLAQSKTGQGYLTALPSHAGSNISTDPLTMPFLVGASPEILIRKSGNKVYSHPLAGTISRSDDPVVDEANAKTLQYSVKDLTEHAYVTEDIHRVLAPYCTELEIPSRPSLTGTSHSWHLGTPIYGVLKDPSITALELAAALHPTPAIGGFPRKPAQERLAELEQDRGFYAGTVGWSDSRGDGEWRVTIRSAILEPYNEKTTVTAHAGSGIVADSSPEEETEETQIKLGPIHAALNISAEDQRKDQHS